VFEVGAAAFRVAAVNSNAASPVIGWKAGGHVLGQSVPLRLDGVLATPDQR
jgi:hypothetical protein